MDERLKKIGEVLSSLESVSLGVRSSLQSEADAKKAALRQSTEFSLVSFQAELESALALHSELLAEENAKQPFWDARLAALLKTAEFTVQAFSGTLLTLAVEEPLFQRYERTGENLSQLSRTAIALRELNAGPAATEEIMSVLGVR